MVVIVLVLDGEAAAYQWRMNMSSAAERTELTTSKTRLPSEIFKYTDKSTGHSVLLREL